MVAGLYAGLVALVYLALGVRVIVLRWRYRVGAGDGGERVLAKAIRVHGNAAEYVPLALVLLLLADLCGAPRALLHGCGIVFVAARLLHAFGLTRTSGPSWPRALGVLGTFGTIGVLSSWLVVAAL